MVKLRASFLPLSSLTSGSDLMKWFDFLTANKLNSWAMLPVHEPTNAPYRSSGFGIATLSGRLGDDLRRYFSPSEIKTIRQQLEIQNQDWLFEASFFKALSTNFRTSDWLQWPTAIRQRQPVEFKQFQKLLRVKIKKNQTQELENLTNFKLLQTLAQRAKIKLIGDLPIYFGYETWPVWTYQHLFQLNPNTSKPIAYSGVPADPTEPFTRQFWGHPLYNWSQQTNAILRHLFARRLTHLKQLGFHTVRIDHVNAFFHYGALTSPRNQNQDQRLAGPGPQTLLKLIRHLRRLRLNFFFEDLASQNKPLQKFMSEQNIPGMHVLTLSFDAETQSFRESWASLTHIDPEHHVVYTSTHDTPPLLLWLEKNLSLARRQQLARLNQLSLDIASQPAQLAIALRQLALANSDAPIIIVPLSDFLLQKQQLNQPGTKDSSNWQYQFPL